MKRALNMYSILILCDIQYNTWLYIFTFLFLYVNLRHCEVITMTRTQRVNRQASETVHYFFSIHRNVEKLIIPQYCMKIKSYLLFGENSFHSIQTYIFYTIIFIIQYLLHYILYTGNTNIIIKLRVL